MNIFQFIGLPADHRSKEKVVMKVKHYSEVPESKKKYPLLGQVKMDGVYCLDVVTVNRRAFFSRTGMRFTNEQYMLASSPRINTPGIYIAELCNDKCSLEELSGMVNPNRKKPLTLEQEESMQHCYLAYHDFLTFAEFSNGVSERSYEYRWVSASNEVGVTRMSRCEYILNIEQKRSFTQECIDDLGEEGAVYKDPDAGWVAGHKGWRMMKEVRGVDYDLLCIGAEEGTGKYKGKVANLFFKWKDGKEIKCMLGKGWTHRMAHDMWYRYRAQAHSSPVGKIFQVYALQESSKGKLRLPKVGELRHDKEVPDVA